MAEQIEQELYRSRGDDYWDAVHAAMVRAENGTATEITRRGTPVARIVPPATMPGCQVIWVEEGTSGEHDSMPPKHAALRVLKVQTGVDGMAVTVRITYRIAGRRHGR